MSYDRQIDQLCPHRVVEEALFLDASRRFVRPMRPISSASSVALRLDGAIEVPSQGVYLPAKVTGTRKGPFIITAGVNDQLNVRVNGGAVQSITVPAGHTVTTARLLDYLSQAITGVYCSNVGNAVQVSTTTEGKGATFMFLDPSPLATYLGIRTGREFRGQTIVPGWTLVNDPTTLLDRPVRMIVFDEPLRTQNSFAELNYVTVRQECRRCGSTGVENDWQYGRNGDTGEVRDEALLTQEIQKLFYTTLGTNPFHVWYGTQLTEMVGKRLTAGNFTQNVLTADIYTAFQRWQSVKRQQEGPAGQPVSDREFPFKLLSVDIQHSTTDPTVLFIACTIQNRSFSPIVLERGLKLPEPLDLLGSTQNQGLIRQSLRGYVQAG